MWSKCFGIDISINQNTVVKGSGISNLRPPSSSTPFTDSTKKTKSLPLFTDPLEHLHYADNQADSDLDQKELKLFIEHWLKAQPEKRREIVKLSYEQDLSSKEISELLDNPQKTVQNTLRNT